MTGPRTLLLDANVLSYFFNAGRKQELAAVAAALQLAVVEEVDREARQHKQRGVEYMRWQPTSGIVVRPLALGGTGATVLAALRGASTGLKDVGELASIGLAVEDPTLRFVTNDKGGAWIAMRELVDTDDRVIRFWRFLRDAQAAAGLRRDAVRDVAAQAHLQHDAPLWWAAWVASLSP